MHYSFLIIAVLLSGCQSSIIDVEDVELAELESSPNDSRDPRKLKIKLALLGNALAGNPLGIGQNLFPAENVCKGLRLSEENALEEATGECKAYHKCIFEKGKIIGFCRLGLASCCYIEPTYMNYYSNTEMIELETTLTFEPVTPTVCQVKVDFLNLNLPQPDDDGICQDGTLVFTGQADANVPELCGVNTGQHVYLTYDAAKTPIVATLITNDVTGSSYQIKTTDIECDDDANLAPDDCLQYFTEDSGKVESFNYAEGLHLANLDYNVCLAEPDCDVVWTEEGPGIDLSSDGTSNLHDDCPDFLEFSDAVAIEFNGDAFDPGFAAPQICGAESAWSGLVLEATSAHPAVHVFTDGNEDDTKGSALGLGSKGFSVSYELFC